MYVFSELNGFCQFQDPLIVAPSYLKILQIPASNKIVDKVTVCQCHA